MGRPVDVDSLQARITADPVIDMHDEIAGI
jgi:hypothetical protein